MKILSFIVFFGAMTVFFKNETAGIFMLGISILMLVEYYGEKLFEKNQTKS